MTGYEPDEHGRSIKEIRWLIDTKIPVNLSGIPRLFTLYKKHNLYNTSQNSVKPLSVYISGYTRN
nr:MAG TPA: hypothetical protein [Caudoviricetes sp.]